MMTIRSKVRRAALGLVPLAMTALAGGLSAQPAPAPAPPAVATPAPGGTLPVPPPSPTGPAWGTPDPNIPTNDLERYFTPATGATAAPDADGFIRRWLLLDPVEKPNRSNTVFVPSYVRTELAKPYFPGQFSALPKAGAKLKVAGKPLEWHGLDSTGFSVKLFNFAQARGKPKYGAIFFVATVVNAPREMKNVRLAVGSNAASMWYLNGQEVAGLYNDRRMVMDDVVSPRLTLKAGRNVIHGAVINGPGLSDFCVRFVDEAGQPVRDLTVTLK